MWLIVEAWEAYHGCSIKVGFLSLYLWGCIQVLSSRSWTRSVESLVSSGVHHLRYQFLILLMLVLIGHLWWPSFYVERHLWDNTDVQWVIDTSLIRRGLCSLLLGAVDLVKGLWSSLVLRSLLRGDQIVLKRWWGDLLSLGLWLRWSRIVWVIASRWLLLLLLIEWAACVVRDIIELICSWCLAILLYPTLAWMTDSFHSAWDELRGCTRELIRLLSLYVRDVEAQLVHNLSRLGLLRVVGCAVVLLLVISSRDESLLHRIY